jgi:hypothetical protein
MFKNVEIGGITVPMLANGATPIRYRHVFHKDIITEFQQAQDDYSKVVNSMPELAFIMAMQAKAQDGAIDLNLLNEDKYLEWVEQFGAMDLPMASEQIINLYLGNNATSSEPKKKVKEKQSEN